MSYTKVVNILSLPEEARQDFIENHDVEDMTTRKLQSEIKVKDASKTLTNAIIGLVICFIAVVLVNFVLDNFLKPESSPPPGGGGGPTPVIMYLFKEESKLIV